MNYSEEELLCESVFAGYGDMYHLYTPERFEIIFTGESEFKIGMGVIALCSKLFPSVRIFTFQLMSNHIHIVLSGDKEKITDLFLFFKQSLRNCFKKEGRYIHWLEWNCSIAKIDSLENARNTIAYVNRNGSVVNPDCSPFSYRWGANRFYFNPEAKYRHKEQAHYVPIRERRDITHSRKFDEVEDLFSVDGYISPLFFCDVSGGEKLFRNTRHYFTKISRNVESFKDVAKTIGESLFYTDDDLFLIAVRKSGEKYGNTKLSMLPKDAKLDIASFLHFEYNAGKKQIQRLLKIDESVLNAMFPDQKF